MDEEMKLHLIDLYRLILEITEDNIDFTLKLIEIDKLQKATDLTNKEIFKALKEIIKSFDNRITKLEGEMKK